MVRRFRLPGGRMVTAAAICAALLAGAFPATAWSATGPSAEASQPAPAVSGEPYDPAGEPETPEAAALAEAAAAGEPVEVLAQRGEAREVFALPDGTLEAREYVVPVWTRLDGAWQPVDLDLAVRADGSVGPVASTVDLTFSGGGSDALVTLARHGREMTRTWPTDLPEPVLDGPRAVYPEVLPGVDLRMEATPDGFTSLLVVKSAAAAANPELEEIRFGMRTSGLEVRVTEDGGLSATDEGSGAVVFEAPTPLMWDSSAVPASEPAGEAPMRAAGKSGRPDEVGPGSTGRLAAMDLSVSARGDELLLKPDLAVLRGEETEYPVFIDPQEHAPRASAWTMVSRYWASSPQWKFNGHPDEGLGYCVGWAGCNANELKRLFYRIDVSRFAGSKILSAEFTVPNVHSAQCVDRPVELWRTKGINSSTTWNTQLASGFWIERLRTESFHYGGSGDGCNPAGDAEFEVKAAVQKAADGKASTMTFGLRAGSESNNLYWKRFGRNAHLRVTYNRPPRQIKMSQLTMEYGGACKTYTSVAHVRTLGQIHANNVTDPDGDALRVQFRVRSGSNLLWNSGLSTAKKSGSTFSVNLPTNLPQNVQLNWEVRSYDGAHYSRWSSAGDPTACYFLYDTSVPEAPTISSNHYPSSDPTDPDDPWYDGVGRYGEFFLESGDSSVNRYRYGINGDPAPANTVTTDSGARKVVAVMPERPGVHFITAQAIDAAGNASETRTYQFRVSTGTEARARWDLDEPAGATQAETSTANRTATVHGGAELGAEGVLGTSMAFDGTSGYAVTPGPVVDTSRSFTVSAWVKLERKPDKAAVVVSQTSAQKPGLQLYYSATSDRWGFLQYLADSPSNHGTARVLADREVRVGEWTHLVGSYSGPSDTMRIFVDGELAGQIEYSSPWSAQGGMQIGAGKYHGEVRHFFPGLIDEVQVFQLTMVSPEASIATLYNKGRITEPPARPADALFTFDEPTGSPTVGAAPDAVPAVFSGGVETGAGGISGNSLRVNGVDGYATTSAGLISTAKSFSVSAWAKLDKGAADSAGIIATQVGSEKPGFELYYSHVYDRWAFNQYSSNDPTATPVRAMQPPGQTAADGEWVHLFGVHDDVKDTLTLYIDGRRVATTELGGSFHADGRIQIGAGQYSGVVKSFFAGEIDDVRLYDRVVTEYEVGQLYQQSPLLQARWKFEEGGGTSPDDSAEGNDLTLYGDAEIGFGWVDLGALSLDGETGYAATTTVPVDTSSSYTVAGWAQAVGVPDAPVSPFSTAGATRSAMAVRFVPDAEDPGWGRWQVAMPDEDGGGASVARVESPLVYDASEWTHLALVYDGFTKRAELYVNGELSEIVCDEDADEACTAAESWTENVLTFEATGSFQVGRARTSGAWGEYWPGAIDDLWAFQGVLTAGQIRQLANGLSLPTAVPTG